MRLIDADALQNLFNETTTSLMKRISIKGIDHFVRACFMTTEMIHAAPTIEAVPVRHGHWIVPSDSVTISCICSECNWESHYYEDDVNGMPYCPNCGAKME